MSFWMCEGDAPLECWDGVEEGYVSCADCHGADGPEDRNCAIAILSEYLRQAGSTGKGPIFAVTGDLRIKGKIIDAQTKKPIQSLPVKLIFPNGLCVSARTETGGRFVLNIKSSEEGRGG